MKKPSFLIIILLLCIPALIALAVFLTGLSERTLKNLQSMDQDVKLAADYLEEMERSPSDIQPAPGFDMLETASDTAEAYEDLTEETLESVMEEPSSEKETQEAQAAIPPAFPIPADHHVIFLGDSRTVGMGSAEKQTGDSCVYIGESGEGYDWLIEFGIDQLDQAIRAWPTAPVVINFGVNDCDAVYSYIEVYRELEKGYPDTSFYYLSVNPVTKESPHVPLMDVLRFNDKLRKAFPEQYIDSCSWMLQEGYEDVDGVHYSERQYCLIHDFAVRSVLEMQDKKEDPAGETPFTEEMTTSHSY